MSGGPIDKSETNALRELLELVNGAPLVTWTKQNLKSNTYHAVDSRSFLAWCERWEK